MNARVSLVIAPVLITLAVVLAPFMPAPFGFWLGLIAAVGGPGLGAPRLLFADGTLTLPERLLIVTLMSIFMTTVILATLNAFGVLMTPLVIAIALLVPTYGTTLAALLRQRGGTAAPSMLPAQPAWLSFGCGVALAALITIGTLRLIGV